MYKKMYARPESSSEELLSGSVENVLTPSDSSLYAPTAVAAASLKKAMKPQMHQAMLTTWTMRPKREVHMAQELLQQTPTMKTMQRAVQIAVMKKPTMNQTLKSYP